MSTETIKCENSQLVDELIRIAAIDQYAAAAKPLTSRYHTMAYLLVTKLFTPENFPVTMPITRSDLDVEAQKYWQTFEYNELARWAKFSHSQYSHNLLRRGPFPNYGTWIDLRRWRMLGTMVMSSFVFGQSLDNATDFELGEAILNHDNTVTFIDVQATSQPD
jgi:hypothetical protein